MQYKSARPCFSTFSKKILLGAIASASLLVPMVASAVMTVNAVQKTNTGNVLQNVLTSNYYYPVYVTTENNLTSPPLAIGKSGTIDPAFTYLDTGQDTDPSLNPATQDGVIYFKVSSSVASFSAQPYLVVTMAQGLGGTSELVPIVGTDGGSGTGVGGCYNNSACFANSAGAQAGLHGTYYYLINYVAGESFTVGISPAAICRSLQQVGGTWQSSVCGTSTFLTGLSTTPEAVSPPMTITFAIYLSSDILNPVTTIPTNAAQDSQAVNLVFQSLDPTGVTPNPSPTPTENCTLNENGVYRPVQGGFQLLAPQNFTVIGDPEGTTPLQLVAIAEQLPTPLATTVGTYTQNQIATPFLTSQVTPLGGFADSTDASNPIEYTLGFMAEDAAGYVFDDGGLGTGTNGCTFPFPFSTSAVQGFLSQSKCFIATAAFRDLNSAPLVLLRSFRDHFLENFSLGRSFVHWYYAWSPNAAEWLIDHPVFRFPVLLALIPLQALAWLVLHPIMMMVLLLMGASIVLWGTLLRRSTE
jgi:hypothetical protein